MTIQRRTALGAMLAAAARPNLAWADDGYPSHVVKMVVPSVPGGATDIIGRVAAAGLAKRFSQAVVVDNRPGAGTSLGAEFVAKAAPDGYTLLLSGIASHAINPVVYKNIAYDPVRSFTAITLVGTLSNVLLVRSDFPAANLKALLAMAREQPNKYAYASVGNGTSPHLSAELLCQMAGVKMVHVPYKGSAPALTDLLAGQIPMAFDNISGGLPFIREGKLRALGVTTAVRSPLLPDVPTFAESGLPGYDVTSWAGLHAPAGLPGPVLQRISTDAMAMLRDPEVVRQLLAAGTTARPMTPPQFADFVASQETKFRVIALRANLELG